MKKKSSTATFESAGNKRLAKYVLRLFVAGTSAKSIRAIQNAREVCEEKLPGRYQLDVIDIFQQPKLARDEQIIAVPTLIKKLPKPCRRLIGDLSDRAGLLAGLDLERS